MGHDTEHENKMVLRPKLSQTRMIVAERVCNCCMDEVQVEPSTNSGRVVVVIRALASEEHFALETFQKRSIWALSLVLR